MNSEVYHSLITETLEFIRATQKEHIRRVAHLKAEAIKANRLLHYCGCGHSLMLCEEVFFRAGGLACVNPIFDTGLMIQHGAVKSSHLEKQEGYTRYILDQYQLNKGDIITIFSTSGRNPVPIDAAIIAKEMGLTTVAITSIQYSEKTCSRHNSGLKLHQVADIVIDNGIAYGDALLDYGSYWAVPGSTLAGAYIINCIMAETLAQLKKENYQPPVLISGNIDGASQKNLKTLEPYRNRVKHL